MAHFYVTFLELADMLQQYRLSCWFLELTIFVDKLRVTRACHFAENFVACTLLIASSFLRRSPLYWFILCSVAMFLGPTLSLNQAILNPRCAQVCAFRTASWCIWVFFLRGKNVESLAFTHASLSYPVAIQIM